MHRKRQARNYVETDREQYQLSLLAHDELMAKAEGYRKRACARRDLANYMLDVVLPQHFDTKILSAAEKLLAARQTGQWGIHADGSPALIVVTGLVSGTFAFAGAIVGVRKDISWIKKWLERHDCEIALLRGD